MCALCVIKLTQQLSCSSERLKTHAALYNSDLLCSGMVSTIRFFCRFLLTVGVFGRSILDCDVYLTISAQMSESHCIFSWKQTLHMINIKQYTCNYCQYLYLTFQKMEWYSINWNIKQIWYWKKAESKLLYASNYKIHLKFIQIACYDKWVSKHSSLQV